MMARRGVILPAVVFVLLIIELLAITALALAYQQLTVANERTSGARAELAARSAVLEIAKRKSIFVQSVAPGAKLEAAPALSDDGASYVVMLERLSPTLFVAHAVARHGPVEHGVRSAAALLLNAPDPLAVLAQFTAALDSENEPALLGGAAITSFAAEQPPLGWPSDLCLNWLSASATSLDAGPALPQRFDRLGDLSLSAVDSLADRHESGVLDLLDVANQDECDAAAVGNWGTPDDQTHACADYFPLIHSAGDLTLRSGAGQGIVVVAGDLTLGEGVRFTGLVLVQGRLSLRSGAEIVGAVLARSVVLDDARIRRSDCAVTRAILQAPALNRLTPRRGRSWIPAF